MRYFKRFILGIVIIMGLSFSAASQSQVSTVKVLDGSKGQFKVDSSITIVDSLYFDPAYNSKLRRSAPEKNIFRLKINQEQAIFFPSPFSVTVKISVDYYINTTTYWTDTVNLVVNYDSAAASTYTSITSYVLNNGFRTKATIIKITKNVSWDVAPALILESEMQSTHRFNFNCSDDAVQQVSYITPSANADELSVSWPTKVGADEYDLEWAFVDSSALADGAYNVGDSLSANQIFLNNATRVTTPANTYKIPLLYGVKGTLFFRVRTAQNGWKGYRMESSWSSDFLLSGGLGQFVFGGHEPTLNWQATTSFAEEGKRKSVVQYFDGSLRGRQMVTKDNSTNTTIVAENFYDNQGRSVIQVLPTPTLSSVIGYARNFNVGLNGTAYDKEHFDDLVDPNTYCDSGAKAMSIDSGAARYYSPNNPDQSGFNKFIPDAAGYPFTEVQYTQDNTGRISRQGGLGPSYKLGSGHETKYYYGTPSQEELDGLFGTEVGYASHYFKNMVKDANGQFSVSYVDMHGRTIATALAGIPDQAKLDTLDSNIKTNITETLADSTSNVVKDLVMEGKRTLLVPVGENYIFNYQLSPAALQILACDSVPVCYDCLYDLEITITDDCNNQNFDGVAFDTTLRNFNLQAIDTTCTNGPQGFSFVFTKYLQPGSYVVTKRLSLNKTALQYYRDSVFAIRNTCRSFNDFIAEQRSLLQINQQCKPSCENCRASLGTLDSFTIKYKTSAGIQLSDTSYNSQIDSAYQQALDDCNILCGTNIEQDDILKAMLLDLTPPSGQYATLSRSSEAFSIFHNVYNDTVIVVPAPYRTATGYVDDDGKLDSVIDDHTGKLVLPQELDEEQFAQKFKLSWAKALLKYHPEYCKLKTFEEYSLSQAWDKRFEQTDTYAAALQKGYLNPSGLTDPKYGRFNGTIGLIDRDPLATMSGNFSILKDSLEGYKTYKATVNGASLKMNLWSLATITIKCPDNGGSCFNHYSSVDSSFVDDCNGDLDMEWRAFRQMYLDLKRKLIDKDIVAHNTPQDCDAPFHPTTSELFTAGYQPHFSHAEDMSALPGVDLPTDGSSASEYQVQVNQKAADFYDANCRAYVTQWLKQLKACDYDPGDSAILMPILINICKEGSDIDHQYGSSSVRPSSTYTPKTFEEAIAQHNALYPKYRPYCSPFLITAPKPYDKQIPYSEKPIYSKPSDCECTKLQQYNSEYIVRKISSDTTLSAYLLRVRKINIAQADIDQLLSMCNPTGTCRYLSHPINLPVGLQCNIGQSCVECYVFDTLYRKFTTLYPDMIPSKTENDSVQRMKNEVFAGFMNYNLGYSKQAWEYLNFKDTCSHYTYTPPPTSNCDNDFFENHYTTSVPAVISTTTLADGTLISVANTTYNEDNKINIIHYSTSGDVLWNKNLVTQFSSALGKTPLIRVNKVIALKDGGFAIGGGVITGNEKWSTFDPMIIKCTSSGNIVWNKAVYVTNFEGYSIDLSDMIEAADSGIVFTGAVPIEGDQSNMGYTNAIVFKLNKSGGISFWNEFNDSIPQVSVALSVCEKNSQLYIGGYSAPDPYSADERNIIVSRVTGANASLLNSKRMNAGMWKPVGPFPDYIKIHSLSDGLILTYEKSVSGFGSAAFLKFDDNISSVSSFKIHDNNSLRPAVSEILSHDSILTVSSTSDYDHFILQKLNIKNPQVVWANKIQEPNYNYSVLFHLNEGPSDNIFEMHATSFTSVIALRRFDGAGRIAGNCNVAEEDSVTIDNTGVSIIDTGWRQVPVTEYNIVNITLSPENDTTEKSVACAGQCESGEPYVGPILCGSSDPVFAATNLEEVDNCSDSTFFIVSKSTELYKEYIDSLNNVFDSAYHNKCMQAYKYELFTVTHDKREYQYTLYYYDQAGNLIKTIPPKGVMPDFSTTTLHNVAAARAAGITINSSHQYITQYTYNTLNQVSAQRTPDAGLSRFWYDKLGRITISQNAKQKASSTTENNRLYSYTLYDYLGRITEIGEIKNASTDSMNSTISRDTTLLGSWITNSATGKSQITSTVYDLAYAGYAGFGVDDQVVQRNLRNRVAYMSYTDGNNTAQFNQATMYTYDVLGNVDTLLQDYGSNMFVTATRNIMNANGNRFKKIVYNYDLISGKVNSVAYQRNKVDASYHAYEYDAENRLTRVRTSVDNAIWQTDARYFYYKHGPLARTILGDQQVQGLDFAYTIQGWLKGINSISLIGGNTDMGEDSKTGSLNQNVAKDVLGFNLNYFTGDYIPIGNVNPFPGHSAHFRPADAGDNRPLYNGNISSMAINIDQFNQPQIYNYKYDQLNRITGMNVYRNLNQVINQWDTLNASKDYNERVKYDPNGNITNYLRYGNSARVMDSLTYNYVSNSNKLQFIRDTVDQGRWLYTDIDNQQSNNYVYDQIGNLTKDRDANNVLDSIKWNVYGKIVEIDRVPIPFGNNNSSTIKYTYDAAGNRISQAIVQDDKTNYTWFVRDAQGNLLSTYKAVDLTSKDLQQYNLTLAEQYVYGINRLGFLNVSANAELGAISQGGIKNWMTGQKQFELSNHLGNVVATVQDKKRPVAQTGSPTTFDHYEAVVILAQDYYPFGMQMPGRQFQRSTTPANTYRFGFNGKANNNDVKGVGNQQDYGTRIYDTRVGRFLSVDPLTKSFSNLTPYQFASNRPIDGIDMDGKEYIVFHVIVTTNADGKPSFRKYIVEDFRGISAEGMAEIHQNKDYAKNFYKYYSESFGPEGRGFKWVYYDDKMNQIGDPIWQMRQSKSLYNADEFSGYYSGSGSITKFGPGTTTGKYSELNNDYDFGYKPMSYADAISKNHDYMQETEIKQPQGWLEDVRTLRSDRILLQNAELGVLETLGEEYSKEDFLRTSKIATFFSAVVRYKNWKVGEMQRQHLDINSAKDQLKVIFGDWKPKFLSKDWFAKRLLGKSGGAASEDRRNTVKPLPKTTP